MIERLNPDITTAAAIIRDTERDDPEGRDTVESIEIALLIDGATPWDILKLRYDYLEATRKTLYPLVDQQG